VSRLGDQITIGRRCIPVGIVALVVLVACFATPVAAQDAIPPNDGWVTDLAGFLTPDEERSLEQLMTSYKAGSGNEIALLTVPDLGGRSLERYALDVARNWGIGQKETHNGALLLVARKEKKIRIEVGRGLEGTLTDSVSGRIIRNVISPEFKQGRFHQGLRAGIEAMHAAAGGDYASIPTSRRRGSPLAGLIPILLIIFLIINMIRGSRGGRGGTGGALPWLILGSGRGRRSHSSGWHGGGGFGGFGGGGGFSGGGASGGW
jgi:uncharacterized protein